MGSTMCGQGEQGVEPTVLRCRGSELLPSAGNVHAWTVEPRGYHRCVLLASVDPEPGALNAVPVDLGVGLLVAVIGDVRVSIAIIAYLDNLFEQGCGAHLTRVRKSLRDQ